MPFEGLERAPDKVLEVAEIVGTETIVVPWVPPPETAAEADDLVERIVGVKDAITGGGLGFAYHNHDFEFRALDDGTDLWSRLKAAGLTTSRTSAGSSSPGATRSRRSATCTAAARSCTPRTFARRPTARGRT